MSSRAFRRLNRDVDIMKISEDAEKPDEEDEGPGFTSLACKKKGPVANPFVLLNDSDEPEDENEEEEEQVAASKEINSGHANKKGRRKKKKKKAKPVKEDPAPPPNDEDRDEVDAAVREVNRLLGEVQEEEGVVGEEATRPETAAYHALLKVDRRFLSAENEMKRIFGSKVVRGDQVRQRAHRKVHLRPTILATPKDSWPKIEKLGLTMQHAGARGGCHYFYLEHSPDYQKIQHRFWDSVETFDPNAIAAILHAHPYHIDSLLQMSEVSKMGEDIQTATELIERALYSFECSFHTLFNYTQAKCRLDYSKAENRSLFLTLFRHLSYVGRRGCHRTALEFCKLLLGLSPDRDPLCVVLMIDYYAIRSKEYQFLINLFNSWEGPRNLSQLPNFAFSVPLAMFHCSASNQQQGKDGEGEEGRSREADHRLQDALMKFPCLLHVLLEKCSVTLDPAVMTHTLFTQPFEREPEGLQLLVKLYVERSHSVWKEPEVLTWLEANCRAVVTRADSKDPLISEYRDKAPNRYTGVPTNIYRHILISDLDRVVAALPPNLTQTSINMYDPLPPTDSTCGYSKPERSTMESQSEEYENPLLLLLRSLLPHYNPTVRVLVPRREGGFARQMHLHIERLRRQYIEREPEQEGGQVEEPAAQLGAEQGAVGGMEGVEGRPLDVQQAFGGLMTTLRDIIHRPTANDHDSDSSADEDI